MASNPPLDLLTVDRTADTAEKESFFGASGVLDYYKDAWLYRTGERYVFERFLGGGHLLDIGCGTGRTSFLLAERFDAIDAFDIVAEMIAVARERNAALGASIRFFVADAMRLPLLSGRYDAVLFSYNGIEGILDVEGRRRVLAEVHRVLRPGGTAVLTTKSCFNRRYLTEFYLPRLLARCGFGRFDGGGPLEVTIYEGGERVRWRTSNPFVMRAQLRAAGFEVLYFNSEIALGRNDTRWRIRHNFHRWDHFYACRKPLAS